MTEEAKPVYRVNYELEMSDGRIEPIDILERARHLHYSLDQPPVIPKQGEYVAFKSDLLSCDAEWLRVKAVFHGITPGPLGDLQHHWVTVRLTDHESIPM